MIKLLSTGRKDDLESLMYILCFLSKGTLPIIEFINKNIDNFHMCMFLRKILSYRKDYEQECRDKVRELMPDHVLSAF